MSARKTRKLAPLSADDVAPASIYKVLNPDPSKHYAWITLNTPSFANYEASGYEPVQWSADPNAPTVFSAGGKKGAPGTPIVRGELALMCVDRKLRERRQLAGIKRVAERRRSLGSRKLSVLSQLDPGVRSGETFEVTNETSRETTEIVS